MQRKDFAGLFKAMDGFPVVIRTLDPPLHEFLPKREELMVDLALLPYIDAKAKKEMAGRYNITVGELKKRVPELLHRVEELHEFNPMLGLRGCRLGILYPEITEMQARAIFEAVVVAAKKGVKVIPEVMIPLIGSVKELENQKAIVVKVAEEVLGKAGMKDQKYMVGTMIEIPRAALTADQVATEAEFFSFGTNDLTQTTLGISRDDYVRFSKIYGARRRRRPSRPTNRKRCARRRRRCKLLFCHRPVPQGPGGGVWGTVALADSSRTCFGIIRQSVLCLFPAGHITWETKRQRGSRDF